MQENVPAQLALNIMKTTHSHKQQDSMYYASNSLATTEEQAATPWVFEDHGSTFDNQIDPEDVDVETIEVPEGFKYLTEFMSELPADCWLDKKSTGCGMTSLAIMSKGKYVIALPYVSAIKGKTEWCRENGYDVIAIHSSTGGRRVEDLDYFTGDTILCTYDQLARVAKELGAAASRDWNLLVDEAHILVSKADFRQSAVDSVINSLRMFKQYTLGTATPPSVEQLMGDLRKLRRVELNWTGLKAVNTKDHVLSNKRELEEQLLNVVMKHLSGEYDGNAHIFINSVTMIGKAVSEMMRLADKLGMTVRYNDFRVVCANKNGNIEKLNAYESEPFIKISDITDPVATINFYTSTAFEGCDVYDATGKSYIFMDANKENTILSIEDSIPQIVGRIRDQINQTVTKFFTPTKNIATTEEEYMQLLDDAVRDSKKLIEDYLTVGSDKMKQSARQLCEDDRFIQNVSSIDGEPAYTIRTATVNYDRYAFRTRSSTFYVNPATGKMALDGKTVRNITYNQEPAPVISALDRVKMEKTTTFQELVEGCVEALKNGNERDAEDIKQRSEEVYKVAKAIAEDRLSLKKAASLGWRKSRIMKFLNSTDVSVSQQYRIMRSLDLRIGSFYTSTDLKSMLKEAYQDAGLKKTAKGTQVTDYYTASEERQTINGQRVRGYRVLGKKLSA